MPQDRAHLFQVRISEEERRRVKTLAASQGMTLQEALAAAIAAWEKELKTHAPKKAVKRK